MTLYRTYRPQRFIELIGQDSITLTLQRALLLERIAHAYLFSGPRGTGKTSAARIFARAIVCEQPVKKTENEYEPCNQCPSCLAILNSQTPDLIEIDAASNRGIEDIRELRSQIQYRPTQLKKKIYIVDEVHMLTTEAFNALLKTLEEPPPHCLFILATTDLHKVPITIRSRCQLLRFQQGEVKSIEKKLELIVQAEKVEVEPEALGLIAKQADGGYRDAETLLENLIVQHKVLTVEVTRKALGIVPETLVTNLLQACLDGDNPKTTEYLKESSKLLAGSPERFLVQLINELRRFIFEQAKTPSYALATLAYALDQFLEAYLLLKSSPLPFLPLEIACLNIASMAPGRLQPPPSSFRAFTPPLEKTEAPIVIQPEALAVERPSVPVVELHTDSEIPSADPRRAWRQMIDLLCQENIPLGQALKQAVFHKAENAVITIHVRFKFHADKMNEKKNVVRIKELLQKYSGQAWEVHFVVTAIAPRQKSYKELAGGPAVAEEAAAVFGQKP